MQVSGRLLAGIASYYFHLQHDFHNPANWLVDNNVYTVLSSQNHHRKLKSKPIIQKVGYL